MSEHIRGSYDDALYKSMYTLYFYFTFGGDLGGPNGRCIRGVKVGRIHLPRVDKAAMRPFVRLLWPLVIIVIMIVVTAAGNISGSMNEVEEPSAQQLSTLTTSCPRLSRLSTTSPSFRLNTVCRGCCSLPLSTFPFAVPLFSTVVYACRVALNRLCNFGLCFQDLQSFPGKLLFRKNVYQTDVSRKKVHCDMGLFLPWSWSNGHHATTTSAASTATVAASSSSDWLRSRWRTGLSWRRRRWYSTFLWRWASQCRAGERFGAGHGEQTRTSVVASRHSMKPAPSPQVQWGRYAAFRY